MCVSPFRFSSYLLRYLSLQVLALVSFLGFPHDRQFGIDELQITLNGGGVRSPVAALALLIHHVFLQGSFCE